MRWLAPWERLEVYFGRYFVLTVGLGSKSVESCESQNHWRKLDSPITIYGAARDEQRQFVN